MNSYSAASDMGDTGIGHRSDCILQCLNDDFDQQSDSQPPGLDAGNVYEADLVDTPPPPASAEKQQQQQNKQRGHGKGGVQDSSEIPVAKKNYKCWQSAAGR